MTARPSPLPFSVRPETPTDRNYVLSSWRRAERESTGQHYREGLRYSVLQDGSMHAILGRASTEVLVAHPSENPDVIAGWLVWRPPVSVVHKGPVRSIVAGPAPIVYFIFVRDEVRRFGIARMLLAPIAERKDVLTTSQPARVRINNEWVRSPLPIPRSWTHCPRAAFVETP